MAQACVESRVITCFTHHARGGGWLRLVAPSAFGTESTPRQILKPFTRVFRLALIPGGAGSGDSSLSFRALPPPGGYDPKGDSLPSLSTAVTTTLPTPLSGESEIDLSAAGRTE